MGRRKQEPFCDRDCLNCMHLDCILNEGPDAAEYRALAQMERNLFRSDAQKKAAAYKKDYYEANREKIFAQRKASREAKHKALETLEKPDAAD